MAVVAAAMAVVADVAGATVVSAVVVEAEAGSEGTATVVVVAAGVAGVAGVAVVVEGEVGIAVTTTMKARPKRLSRAGASSTIVRVRWSTR